MHEVGWREREREEDAVFDAAHAFYLEKRDELAEMIVRRVAPELTDTTFKIFSRKIAEKMVSWEVPLRRARRQAFAKLDPHYQLKEQVENVTKFKALLDASIKAEEIQPTPNGANAVGMYHRNWQEANKRLMQVEKDLGIAQDREIDGTHWKEIRSKHVRALRRDYKGKGQIYLMYIDRLASLQTALTKLEEEGRMESVSYKDFQTAFTEVAAQIQKHTEVTKTENLDIKVEEIGTNLMRIVEAVLINQPATLALIYTAIQANVDNVAQGKVIQLPQRASA